MDKITVLKPDISVEKEIELLDPIEDKGEITALRWVSARALITITDEEIENQINELIAGDKTFFKTGFKAGAHMVIQYIKSRINQ